MNNDYLLKQAVYANDIKADIFTHIQYLSIIL